MCGVDRATWNMRWAKMRLRVPIPALESFSPCVPPLRVDHGHCTPRQKDVHSPSSPRHFLYIIKSLKPPTISGDSSAQGSHRCSPFIKRFNKNTGNTVFISELIMAQPGRALDADGNLGEYPTLSLAELEHQFAEGQREGQVRLNHPAILEIVCLPSYSISA